MNDIIEQNNLDERFVPLTRVLRLPEVTQVCGISKSLLYSLMANGEFPRSISLGGNVKGWIDADIQEWINERIAARDGQRA